MSSIKKLKKIFDVKLSLDQIKKEARKNIEYSTPLTRYDPLEDKWETVPMDFNNDEMLTVKELHAAEMEVYLVIEAMKEELLDLHNLD
tara:strand:- start:11738 stop:12001 length:264 start_codon:yes stop_codon:yes gene_type:complete